MLVNIQGTEVDLPICLSESRAKVDSHTSSNQGAKVNNRADERDLNKILPKEEQLR